jgi:tRNA (guanine37-N1)-methyltransferase
MFIDIVTLFPEMFAPLDYGICGRAIKKGLVEVNYWNPRDYTQNKHRTVDDYPYGGGPGMVMKVQPLLEAIDDAKQARMLPASVIYVTPQGKPLDQKLLHRLTSQPALIFVAGRYEGVDERLIELAVDEELSIGDYVLSGGELAIMVIIDGLVRLLPNALGDHTSALQDSFVDGLLDYPHYTRPECVAGKAVPEVLLSGNHADIARWRMKQALGRTWAKRPDLLAKCHLTPAQQALLNEYIREKLEGEET